MSNNAKLYMKVFSRESFLKIADVLRDQTDIKYAVIKGEALSKQMYGKPGQRFSSDVDVLIPRTHIHKFERSLGEFGFSHPAQSRSEKIMMLSASHQTAPWVKKIYPWGAVVVDINFDIFWGEYEGARIDMEEFLSDPVEMEIYGVKVKTLPPLKALIQLALHHYKDMNSIFLLATRKSIKPAMFRDVYYLLRNNLDAIPRDRLYEVSAAYGIVPYVFYILYYTGQVYEDAVLREYIETFRTSEGEALLGQYGLCGKERKTWKCDFSTRLAAENLYEWIQDDLTEQDREKIALNKRIFMGVSE